MSDQIQKSVPGTVRVVCSPAASGSGAMAALIPVSAETSAAYRPEMPVTTADSPVTGTNRKQRANGMPQELRERICRDYAAGAPSPVLAARYGFSHGYIRSIASKAGVSVRVATIKRARQPKFTAQQITDIAQRMRSGAAAVAIAADYGMSDEALRSRALRIPVLMEIGFNSPSPRVKTSHRTGYAVGIRRHAPLARIAEPTPADGVTLMDLKPNACKFPSGDGPVVFCCKARRVAGKPYCQPHISRAYRCEGA